MARVLVTGANGHIGANTVRCLLRRGHEVVPLVRRGANLRGLEGLGLTYRHGDVMDAPLLTAAAEGCDVIVHHAAVYRLWARDPGEIVEPALVGTENVYQAARQAGVRRLVYTSSIAAVGHARRPDQVRTAADWNDDARNPYYVAKTRAERAAVRLSAALDVPTIRICPAAALGPYDYRLTPSTKMVLDLINETNTTYEGGSNLVDVRDVAEVHAAAVEMGEPGGRYIVAGENLHQKDLAQLIQELAGVTPRHIGITGPLAYLIATFVELGSILTGAEPPFSRSVVHDVIGRYAYYDCTPTYETFGLAPRPAREVVRDCVRWLLYVKQIDPDVAARISDALPPDPEWQ